ncbi:MAG: hypothetical protein AAF944_24405 [Bacteroidota bacterium]
MKIGLSNIFTTLWFLLMIGSGGTLTYIAVSERLFIKDTILIAKIFLVVLAIITVATLIVFLVKFQLLIITRCRIISIKPFLLKRTKIELEKIKKISWGSWDYKGTLFKTIEITESRDNKIAFSDFEFENFEKLITRIPKATSTPNRNKIYQEQAKRNLSMTNFILVIAILSLGVLLFKATTDQEYTLIHLTSCVVLILMITASVKRRIRYLKIRNTAHNKLQ